MTTAGSTGQDVPEGAEQLYRAMNDILQGRAAVEGIPGAEGMIGSEEVTQDSPSKNTRSRASDATKNQQGSTGGAASAPGPNTSKKVPASSSKRSASTINLADSPDGAANSSKGVMGKAIKNGMAAARAAKMQRSEINVAAKTLATSISTVAFAQQQTALRIAESTNTALMAFAAMAANPSGASTVLSNHLANAERRAKANEDFIEEQREAARQEQELFEEEIRAEEDEAMRANEAEEYGV